MIKPLCGASVFAEQEPKYFLAGIAPCCDSKIYSEESETTTDTTDDDDDDDKATTGGVPSSYNDDWGRQRRRFIPLVTKLGQATTTKMTMMILNLMTLDTDTEH